MSLRQAWIITGIILVGMAVLTVLAWSLLPPGQPIPIHFTMDGTPNRFAPREAGLSILPALALLVAFVMGSRAARGARGSFIPLADRPLSPIWIVVLAVLVGGQALIIGYALHPSLSILRLFFGAIGVLIAVLGGAMSRIEPDALIGIRTPWTRADPRVWRATHRFGSAVFVIAGIVLAGMAAFSQHPVSLAPVMLVDVVVAALVCVLYSYLVSRSAPGGSARRGR